MPPSWPLWHTYLTKAGYSFEHDPASDEPYRLLWAMDHGPIWVEGFTSRMALTRFLGNLARSDLRQDDIVMRDALHAAETGHREFFDFIMGKRETLPQNDRTHEAIIVNEMSVKFAQQNYKHLTAMCLERAASLRRELFTGLTEAVCRDRLARAKATIEARVLRSIVGDFDVPPPRCRLRSSKRHISEQGIGMDLKPSL